MPLGDGSILTEIAHPSLPGSVNRIILGVVGSGKAFGDTITVRRGDTTLSAQNVLIGPSSGVTSRESPGAQEQVADAYVIGDTSLDIEVGDRFNDRDGLLYEVLLIRPGRTFVTVAEAEILQ